MASLVNSKCSIFLQIKMFNICSCTITRIVVQLVFYTFIRTSSVVFSKY